MIGPGCELIDERFHTERILAGHAFLQACFGQAEMGFTDHQPRLIVAVDEAEYRHKSVAAFDRVVKSLQIVVSQGLQEPGMPGESFVTRKTPPNWFFFVEYLRFGAEIVLRKVLETPWGAFRTLFIPFCDEFLDIFGKKAVKVVGRIVFADVCDAGVERHQFSPSITRTN